MSNPIRLVELAEGAAKGNFAALDADLATAEQRLAEAKWAVESLRRLRALFWKEPADKSLVLPPVKKKGGPPKLSEAEQLRRKLLIAKAIADIGCLGFSAITKQTGLSDAVVDKQLKTDWFEKRDGGWHLTTAGWDGLAEAEDKEDKA